ncbi:MAG TPA: pitrilysin family protein [Candidatus Paceibacterota bacterium]|nr:pitrilysin family protein [Candidatus Paceibacterota bacterium]
MNITEHEKGAMRFFASRTGAKDMVVIRGSVLGGYHMLDRKEQMVPALATALLDAGTKTKSKEAIRSALTARGASIQFSPGGDRTHFSATCLPEDTEFVLKMIADCLRDALFSANELALEKKRKLAELEETKTETRSLANDEFFRTIYDRTHANYVEPIAEHIAQTSKTTRSNLLSYQKLLGKGGLVLAITGDISPEHILLKAERAFNSLANGTLRMSEKRANTVAPKAMEKRIFVADKANIDVMMGAHVPFTYDSPEFIPFTFVTSMLGARGISTGHLMRTIRERDGLTYGIYANPVGFAGGADGAFQIWATFSPATYEKAVEATQKEIEIFLTTGITPALIESKKVELVGRYAIGLATSGGLANTLHTIGIEGKPLSYIEEYPDLINTLTRKDLLDAASQVPFDKLTVVSAGTLDAKKK